MRLAFVELEFNWPPQGGSQIDVAETMGALQALGHEVHLFSAAYEQTWRHGDADEALFPHPMTQLWFRRKPPPAEELAGRFKAAVANYAPDAVILCLGAFLKMHVAAALQDYPLISRYYAHEALCLRDWAHYRNGAQCPYDYPSTPDICRRCFFDTHQRRMRAGSKYHLIDEFLELGGMTGRFYRFYVEQLQRFDAIVVNNQTIRQRLLPYNPRTYVFPGGAHVLGQDFELPLEKGRAEKKIILMSGRVDDPLKGADKLQHACAFLAERRDDFELWLTADPPLEGPTWLRAAGWQRDAEGLRRLYRQADICVTPSLWPEPFGLVAVEAMAAARPVVASRIGGLQDIVIDGHTGLLYERTDEQALAQCLERLLDDANLRREMGAAGRRRAEEEYDWQRLVKKHWPPLLEQVTHARA